MSIVELTDPPVVEMAIGVQFRPLFNLRGILLGRLRDQWRATYPIIEEQPPLAPAIEGQAGAGINLMIAFGPVPNVRYWFMSQTGAAIVQLQNDRIVVNWRRVEGGEPYPRYHAMAERFQRAIEDLTEFVISEQLGRVDITQVELSYINAAEAVADDGGMLEMLLRGWQGTPQHHLGQPAQSRLQMSFNVPELGRSPVRMFVSLEPDMDQGGTRELMTLGVRGQPADGSVGAALEFLRGAHEHLVRSFLELTPESMHATWGLNV